MLKKIVSLKNEDPTPKRQPGEKESSYFIRLAEWSEERAVKFKNMAETVAKKHIELDLSARYASIKEKGIESADDNDLYSLACDYYEKGIFEKAVELYKVIADKNHALAQYNLADMYLKGEGVSINPAKALKWFARAAEQGYSDAQYMLGELYFSGYGCRRNFTEAAHYYKLSAEQGDNEAKHCLAGLYVVGVGVEQDLEKAINLYVNALIDGYEVARDALWELVGRQLTPELNLKLGQLLQSEGDAEIAEKNKDLIENCYSKAAYNYYMRVTTEGADDSKAALTKLKVMADVLKYPVAQHNLAVLYSNGDGVEQNFETAINYYVNLLPQGFTEARDNLHRLVEKLGPELNIRLGQLLQSERDAEIAEKNKGLIENCYSKAAYNYFMRATTEGADSATVTESAASLKKIADDLDNPIAQHNLAILYVSGNGVEKDIEKSMEYYYKAMSKGIEGARDALFQVVRVLSPELNLKLGDKCAAMTSPMVDVSKLTEACFNKAAYDYFVLSQNESKNKDERKAARAILEEIAGSRNSPWAKCYLADIYHSSNSLDKAKALLKSAKGITDDERLKPEIDTLLSKINGEIGVAKRTAMEAEKHRKATSAAAKTESRGAVEKEVGDRASAESDVKKAVKAYLDERDEYFRGLNITVKDMTKEEKDEKVVIDARIRKLNSFGSKYNQVLQQMGRFKSKVAARIASERRLQKAAQKAKSEKGRKKAVPPGKVGGNGGAASAFGGPKLEACMSFDDAEERDALCDFVKIVGDQLMKEDSDCQQESRVMAVIFLAVMRAEAAKTYDQSARDFRDALLHPKTDDYLLRAFEASRGKENLSKMRSIVKPLLLELQKDSRKKEGTTNWGTVTEQLYGLKRRSFIKVKSGGALFQEIATRYADRTKKMEGGLDAALRNLFNIEEILALLSATVSCDLEARVGKKGRFEMDLKLARAVRNAAVHGESLDDDTVRGLRQLIASAIKRAKKSSGQGGAAAASGAGGSKKVGRRPGKARP